MDLSKRQWLVFGVLLVSVLGLPPLIWLGAGALSRVSPAPVSWQVHWSWTTFLGCLGCSYGLRRSLPAQRGRFVVAGLVVASAVLSPVLGFGVAWATGKLLPLVCLSFPMLGMCLGQHLGELFPGRRRPRSSR